MQFYKQELADIKSGKRNPPPGMSNDALEHFDEMLWEKLKILEALMDANSISEETARAEMKELIKKSNQEAECYKRRLTEEAMNAKKIFPKSRLY